MKKIAVIIPNYNGFSYSGRCFEALEKQTFKDFEVCVIDDCSTDDSYEKLKKYEERSPLCIKVLRSPKNMGPGHSRKVGIEATDSEWIAFCDIDDWYDDDFLDENESSAEPFFSFQALSNYVSKMVEEENEDLEIYEEYEDCE